MGRLIDEIDGNAGGARGFGEALRVPVVIEAGDGDGSAAEVFGLPCPMLQHDRAARRRLRGQSVKLLAWTLGKHDNVGAGRRQQLRFPGHGRAVAGNHRPFAVERQEDRQPRERLHARGTLRATETARDARHQYTSC